MNAGEWMPKPELEGQARWMLLLNTCGDPGEVGLANLAEGAVPHLIMRSLPGRQTQERLLPEMASLLEECRILPSDISVVAVVNGPGSFTGVRVGLAAALGLAEALSVPVLLMSRLAVLAAQDGEGPITEAWLQAGRGDVFRGRYRDGRCVEEAMLPGSVALAELPESGAVVVEEELLTLSPRLQLVRAGLTQVLPLAMRTFQAGETIDAAQADANYLRVPDAELARQARTRAAQATG